MNSLLGSNIDLSICKDELGHYNGTMTLHSDQCADWLDLSDGNHENPVLNDMLTLDNFPDESHAIAGNKCR